MILVVSSRVKARDVIRADIWKLLARQAVRPPQPA